MNGWRGGLWVLILIGTLSAKIAWAADWLYSVRPGDTLWGVAERYLHHTGYVERLRQLNEVSDPYRLQPGTRLRIPVAWMRVQPVPVSVVGVTGPVEVRTTPNAPPEPLVAGRTLGTGAAISAGPGATVVLEFADGSRFTLSQGSEVVLDTVSAYGDSGMVDVKLRLQGGRFNGHVEPAAGPGTRYEINTPAAQTAVRGTDYRVGYDSAEAVLRAEVLEGRVTVSARGVTRSVPANHGTVAERGLAPSLPRQLLPPPDTAPLAQPLTRLPLTLDWPDLPGAAGYRVQIDRGAAFESLLLDVTTQSSRLQLPDLADGDYWLRLRGIDALGLEGRDAVLGIVIDARPEPPFRIAPTDNQVVRTALPAFAWSAVDGADAYHFQLAADPDFGTPLIDLPDFRGTAFTPESLPPGEYYWRLATLAGGERGPLSDAMGFALRPTPDPEPPELGENEISFQWPAGLSGERYRFQLARDRGFEDLLVDREQAEPRITLERPPGGNEYFMRYAVIGEDGEQGPFSTIQRIVLPIDDYTPFVIFGIISILLLL